MNLLSMGGELPQAITGWRFEYTTHGRLLNFNGVHIAARCLYHPHRQGFMIHRAPHPRCTCGLRIVKDLTTLSAYLSRVYKIRALNGLGIDDKPQVDGIVIAKVRATGIVYAGAAIDPSRTLRAENLELLSIYAPPTVPERDLRARYDVPIHEIADLGDGLFSEVAQGELPSSPNTIQDIGPCFLLQVGPYRLAIDKGDLTDEVKHGINTMRAQDEQVHGGNGVHQTRERVAAGLKLFDRMGLAEQIPDVPDDFTRVGVARGAGNMLAAMLIPEVRARLDAFYAQETAEAEGE